MARTVRSAGSCPARRAVPARRPAAGAGAWRSARPASTPRYGRTCAMPAILTPRSAGGNIRKQAFSLCQMRGRPMTVSVPIDHVGRPVERSGASRWRRPPRWMHRSDDAASRPAGRSRQRDHAAGAARRRLRRDGEPGRERPGRPASRSSGRAPPSPISRSRATAPTSRRPRSGARSTVPTPRCTRHR